jgi:hypothetical protein
MILAKKTDEERKLCTRVEDLELQLSKEKEDCQRSFFLQNTSYFSHQLVCVFSRRRIPILGFFIMLPFQFRMTSKTKKLIKAHGRYIKAKDDLKRQVSVNHMSNIL